MVEVILLFKKFCVFHFVSYCSYDVQPMYVYMLDALLIFKSQR